MSNLTITDWAEEDRPRERLERLGAEALSNAELLAILIGSGTPKMSAVELMKVVLAACHNNLNTLGKMSIKDLENFKGIGPAKAITILAACELGKRRAREKAEIREDLGSATAVYNYMHPRMQDLDVGGVSYPLDESELQTYQRGVYQSWWHHGDGCRHTHHYEGSHFEQCHGHGGMP